MVCGAVSWYINKFCKELPRGKCWLIFFFSLQLPFISQRQSNCNFNKKLFFTHWLIEHFRHQKVIWLQKEDCTKAVRTIVNAATKKAPKNTKKKYMLNVNGIKEL